MREMLICLKKSYAKIVWVSSATWKRLKAKKGSPWKNHHIYWNCPTMAVYHLSEMQRRQQTEAPISPGADLIHGQRRCCPVQSAPYVWKGTSRGVTSAVSPAGTHSTSTVSKCGFVEASIAARPADGQRLRENQVNYQSIWNKWKVPKCTLSQFQGQNFSPCHGLLAIWISPLELKKIFPSVQN